MGSRLLEANDSGPRNGSEFGVEREVRPACPWVLALASSAPPRPAAVPTAISARRSIHALAWRVAPSLRWSLRLDVRRHPVEQFDALGLYFELHSLPTNMQVVPGQVDLSRRRNQIA